MILRTGLWSRFFSLKNNPLCPHWSGFVHFLIFLTQDSALDIRHVDYVLHFDVPREPRVYVHRVGINPSPAHTVHGGHSSFLGFAHRRAPTVIGGHRLGIQTNIHFVDPSVWYYSQWYEFFRCWPQLYFGTVKNWCLISSTTFYSGRHLHNWYPFFSDEDRPPRVAGRTARMGTIGTSVMFLPAERKAELTAPGGYLAQLNGASVQFPSLVRGTVDLTGFTLFSKKIEFRFCIFFPLSCTNIWYAYHLAFFFEWNHRHCKLCRFFLRDICSPPEVFHKTKDVWFRFIKWLMRTNIRTCQCSLLFWFWFFWSLRFGFFLFLHISMAYYASMASIAYMHFKKKGTNPRTMKFVQEWVSSILYPPSFSHTGKFFYLRKDLASRTNGSFTMRML